MVDVLTPAIDTDLTAGILEQEFAFENVVLALLSAALGTYPLQWGFAAQR
jgi:hypothetical protein